MIRPVVVLFDIDGTLVVSGGAGRRSMGRAFADEGLSPLAGDFDYGGMTDRAIVRQALASRVDSVPSESDIDRCLERYLEYLRDEIPRSSGYRVLPGAVELAQRLLVRERTAVGLGTGNVVRGAEIKLGRAGVYELFSFGGFGCDHEDRSLLLGKGVERGRARLDVHTCDVVIIGDTPKDVAAGHAIGARVLAVATGRNSAAELAACGAHLAVEELTDPRVESFIAEG